MSTPCHYELTAIRTLRRDGTTTGWRQPGPDKAHIETLASAISPGTELAAWLGLQPLRPTPNPYPRVLGYCNIGRVLSPPDGESDLKAGDHVLTHAPHHSDFHASPSQILARVPPGADLVAASTTYLFHLGYTACLASDLTMGMRVAVIGLGTVGLTTAAMVARAGAEVVGFSNHTTRRPFHDQFGLSAIHPKADWAGEPFDLVISTANGWPDWRLACELARRGGAVTCLGFPGRGQALPGFNPLDSAWFYDKQLTLRSCGYAPDLDVPEIDRRFTLKRNCRFLLGEILAGRLPGRALVAESRRANELEAVYAALAAHRNDGQTVVLDWGMPD